MDLELSDLPQDKLLLDLPQASLLSRMKDQETPEIQHELEHEVHSQMSPEHPSPSLLSRMTYLKDLQGMPLRQTRGSIRMYSYSAMPSSRSIVRGRCLKHLYMLTFNPNSSKHLATTGNGLTPRLGRSLPLLRAMTWSQLEVEMAARRAAANRPRQHSASPPVSDTDDQPSDGEPASKKPKLNESAYAWVAERKGKPTLLLENLSKSLKLLNVYTIDPKAAKHLLTNQPECPEFPDPEWKNVISGRVVNLDAVLSGQLSTTNDDLKVEKFGDIEVSFGVVEPTKVVKNGGDWSIAWNRTVRAIVFAFPHRHQELTRYGEYIINLFSVTHPTVHA